MSSDIANGLKKKPTGKSKIPPKKGYKGRTNQGKEKELVKGKVGDPLKHPTQSSPGRLLVLGPSQSGWKLFAVLTFLILSRSATPFSVG